jgi:hypothetical protein
MKDLGYNEKGEMGRTNFDEEVKLNEKDQISELEMSELSRRHAGNDTLDSIDS